MCQKTTIYRGFEKKRTQNIEKYLPFSEKLCIMKNVAYTTIYSSMPGENFVRNRGYKYIIDRDDMGYLMLCINPTWISDLLKMRNINPSLFRSISWKEMAAHMKDRYAKELFCKLQPSNFWQMCDVFALTISEYIEDFEMPVYEQTWFPKYPIFAAEDVYELLLEEGMDQEDALRITEVVRKGRCSILDISVRDYLELYDVPEELVDAITSCEYLADRQEVVNGFLDTAMEILKAREENKNSLV